MGELHAAGSHPAQNLGLCAAHKAPGHHRGSPSCARGAGKGRVSGLVGRVGALKSSPYANLRAGLEEIPNTPRGAPRGCCTLEGWPAARRRGSQAACPQPAKSPDLPPSPRPRPAPSQPAPLLAQLAPCPVKIMVTTTASREELAEGPGGGEVEANPRGRHRQGGVLSPPSSPTQRTQRRPGTGSPQ